jgi:hypothetical protein
MVGLNVNGFSSSAIVLSFKLKVTHSSNYKKPLSAAEDKNLAYPCLSAAKN